MAVCVLPLGAVSVQGRSWDSGALGKPAKKSTLSLDNTTTHIPVLPR